MKAQMFGIIHLRMIARIVCTTGANLYWSFRSKFTVSLIICYNLFAIEANAVNQRPNPYADGIDRMWR